MTTPFANRKIESWAWVGVVVGLLSIATAGIALTNYVVKNFTTLSEGQMHLAQRVAEIQESKQNRDSEMLLAIGKLTDRIDTALQVLGDHGTELEGLRADIRSLREADRSIIADITSKTSDRYRRADAQADALILREWVLQGRLVLDQRMIALEKEIARMEKILDAQSKERTTP